MKILKLLTTIFIVFSYGCYHNVLRDLGGEKAMTDSEFFLSKIDSNVKEPIYGYFAGEDSIFPISLSKHKIFIYKLYTRVSRPFSSAGIKAYKKIGVGIYDSTAYDLSKQSEFNKMMEREIIDTIYSFQAFDVARWWISVFLSPFEERRDFIYVTNITDIILNEERIFKDIDEMEHTLPREGALFKADRKKIITGLKQDLEIFRDSISTSPIKVTNSGVQIELYLWNKNNWSLSNYEITIGKKGLVLFVKERKMGEELRPKYKEYNKSLDEY